GKAARLESLTVTRDNGPALHVLARGDAKNRPVLFVHGLSTTAEVFAHQLERLSPIYRALAIDLPGHGGPVASNDSSASAFADAVERAIETLGLEKAVLVGWSSGGQVALEVARRRGAALAGLVLVDSAPLTVPDPVQHPTYNGGGTLDFAWTLRLALESADQS